MAWFATGLSPSNQYKAELIALLIRLFFCPQMQLHAMDIVEDCKMIIKQLRYKGKIEMGMQGTVEKGLASSGEKPMLGDLTMLMFANIYLFFLVKSMLSSCISCIKKVGS